jgi:uncharacterized FAD-dependent dehydrogenase
MNPPRNCTVLILGSGPAGLFAADHLLRAGVRDIVIVEQGRPMTRRVCPDGSGCDCRRCEVLDGEGGAGSFSDGKITLSATRGTHTEPLFTPEQARLLGEVGTTLRRFTTGGIDHAPVDAYTALGDRHEDLRAESYPLLHVGSDGIREFGHRFSADLQRRGVRLLSGMRATHLLVTDRRVLGAVVVDPCTGIEAAIIADLVIAAVGMSGTPWLEAQLREHGVTLTTGPADLGIRVETDAAVLAPLIDEFYDFKLTHTSPAGIRLRSFCVNGHGFLVNEYHQALGIRAVNGHSYLARRSGRSNLAIMATITPERESDPKAYVRDLARAINQATGGHTVHQSLTSFAPSLATGAPIGFASTNPKTRPAHLDQVLPPVLVEAYTSFLAKLGKVLPPLLAPDTLLCAPEIKYFAYRVPVDPATWESTDLQGLFVVGNAAGYTASLSAAALTGIIAAREAASQLLARTR